MGQELMHSLSIRTRTNAYPEHAQQFLTRMLIMSVKISILKKGPSKYAVHAHQKLNDA
jgi:hypothetical protein